MSGRSRGAAVLAVAALLATMLALVEGVAARGGRGGGGGFRGGGGIDRGGLAARGSFDQHPQDFERGEYDRRGLAADGSFDLQHLDQEQRQERRQERREERREQWQDGVYYGGTYYYGDDGEPLVYWALPCEPDVIALGDVVYLVCGATWYVRVYFEGELAYAVVPNPNEP